MDAEGPPMAEICENTFLIPLLKQIVLVLQSSGSGNADPQLEEIRNYMSLEVLWCLANVLYGD